MSSESIRSFRGASSQLLIKKKWLFFHFPPKTVSGSQCAVSVPWVLFEQFSKLFLLPSQRSYMADGDIPAALWACLFPVDKAVWEQTTTSETLTSEDSPRVPAGASTLETLQRYPMQFLTAGFCVW